jgi:hypothetical protein
MLEIRVPDKIECWVCDAQESDVSYLVRFSPPEALEHKSEFERLDYILLDWKGIVFNGEPAPCTRENKLSFFSWDVEQNDAVKYWFLYSSASTMTTFVDLKKTLARLRAPSSGGSTSLRQAPNGVTSAN